MAFLDSTGELTDEARAAFMEAMIEEEDSEEEDEVRYCYLGFEIFILLFWIWSVMGWVGLSFVIFGRVSFGWISFGFDQFWLWSVLGSVQVGLTHWIGT